MHEVPWSCCYSPRTEQVYRDWACLPRGEATLHKQVERFIYFHHVRHSADVAEPEVNAFLPDLAAERENQYLNSNSGSQYDLVPVSVCPAFTGWNSGGAGAGSQAPASARRHYAARD